MNDLPMIGVGLVVLSFSCYNKPMVYLFIFIVCFILWKSPIAEDKNSNRYFLCFVILLCRKFKLTKKWEQ